MERMPNSMYAQTSGFTKAVKAAAKVINPQDVETTIAKLTTRRQASKYRRKTGLVYKTINNLPH